MSKKGHESSSASETQIKCFKCGGTDRKVALFAVRFKSKEKWVCARCLPFLIHGG